MVNVKIKCTPVQVLRLCTGRMAYRRSRGIALTFHDHGTRSGWEVSVTPRPLFTPGKTTYSLYRRLGGPQGRSGQVRKISLPPGFDARTVHPVTSRYTDYATRPITQFVDGSLSLHAEMKKPRLDGHFAQSPYYYTLSHYSEIVCPPGNICNLR